MILFTSYVIDLSFLIRFDSPAMKLFTSGSRLEKSSSDSSSECFGDSLVFFWSIDAAWHCLCYYICLKRLIYSTGSTYLLGEFRCSFEKILSVDNSGTGAWNRLRA